MTGLATEVWPFTVDPLGIRELVPSLVLLADVALRRITVMASGGRAFKIRGVLLFVASVANVAHFAAAVFQLFTILPLGTRVVLRGFVLLADTAHQRDAGPASSCIRLEASSIRT